MSPHRSSYIAKVVYGKLVNEISLNKEGPQIPFFLNMLAALVIVKV